ncbi:MAG: hypothetical protein WC436_06815 [Candidatus Babeliales bacterium]
MELRKFISTIICEYLNDRLDLGGNIKDVLIKRIPFLKEYTIFKNTRDEDRLSAQRVVYNKDVKVVMADKILEFPQYNISSEIVYYPHKINENTFHNFIIKNEFHMTQPKDMDDLTFRVFLMAKKQLEEKLSYRKDVMVKSNEDIPENELDKIINEMNRVLFKIEEFSKKHHFNLF